MLDASFSVISPGKSIASRHRYAKADRHGEAQDFDC